MVMGTQMPANVRTRGGTFWPVYWGGVAFFVFCIDILLLAIASPLLPTSCPKKSQVLKDLLRSRREFQKMSKPALVGPGLLWILELEEIFEGPMLGVLGSKVFL